MREPVETVVLLMAEFVVNIGQELISAWEHFGKRRKLGVVFQQTVVPQAHEIVETHVIAIGFAHIEYFSVEFTSAG